MPALSAIAAPESVARKDSIPDLETLAQLLFFSAGVTRSKKYEGGETFFRAAACTGALYEIELYIACTDLKANVGPGIPAGLYHFGAAEFGLRQLRSGDFREVLVKATSRERLIARAPIIIICTGTYWRNAWKYRSRAYRHFGWDNGTILANLLATAAALKLPARVLSGFIDSEVNALLGLDTTREAAFSIVSVGYKKARIPRAPEVGPLSLPVVPYSGEEVDYPAMRRMHDASSFDSPAELKNWRGKTPSRPGTPTTGDTRKLQLPDESRTPHDSIEKVISRRGSTRQFARDPITQIQLALILDRATRGIAADFLNPFGAHLNDLYLIVNSVVGLTSGAYVYHWEKRSLELLKPGEFRDKAGYLGLEQQLAADAAVDVFFLADLKKILEHYGNRGYRAVQLEAGILGGRFYLAAYAQGLGATGLTFYDDDVVNFFAPHARGKSAIFLVALGRSALKRNTA
jgi:SagB-type dehydrogenase family enzyme